MRGGHLTPERPRAFMGDPDVRQAPRTCRIADSGSVLDMPHTPLHPGSGPPLHFLPLPLPQSWPVPQKCSHHRESEPNSVRKRQTFPALEASSRSLPLPPSPAPAGPPVEFAVPPTRTPPARGLPQISPAQGPRTQPTGCSRVGQTDQESGTLGILSCGERGESQTFSGS